MDQSKVSLSWDAYSKNICNGLGLLQQRGEFVDMTLAADGYHVKVHQIVLSLVSPYIKDLIKTADCPHPVIFLNKVSYDTLQCILEYVYTGEVIVDPDRLDCFLETCKELHITGLEDFDTKEDDKDFLSTVGKLNKPKEEPSNKFQEIFLESPLLIPRKRRRMDEAEESFERLFTNDEDDVESDDDAYQTEADDETDVTNQAEDDVKHDKIRPKNKMRVKYLSHGTDYEEIVPYKAGSKWVFRDDHYYIVARTKGRSIYFRCSTSECSVRWKWSMITGTGPIIGEHNHEPTHWVRSRNSMFQVLRERSKSETTVPLNVIYEQEAAKYQEAIPYLPYESVAPSMRKWRQAAKSSYERSLQSTG